MRCTNEGSSYTSQDIEWACTAAVPSDMQLDRTEVICEGYADADDAYVLRGSCGVEYTLRVVKGGERDGESGGGWVAFLFWVVFFGVLGWILVSMVDGDVWRALGNGGGGGGGPGWGGGGGGGGWGWGRGDDPPPPYSGSGPKPSSSGEGWSPGFWTGLASGAAAGYTAGSRGQWNNDRYNRDYARPSWGSRSGSGSGYGGGNGESSSSASSSGSGARHESTGYGSTSRR